MLLNLKKPAVYEDFRERQLLDAKDPLRAKRSKATVVRRKAETAKKKKKAVDQHRAWARCYGHYLIECE